MPPPHPSCLAPIHVLCTLPFLGLIVPPIAICDVVFPPLLLGLSFVVGPAFICTPFSCSIGVVHPVLFHPPWHLGTYFASIAVTALLTPSTMHPMTTVPPRPWPSPLEQYTCIFGGPFLRPSFEAFCACPSAFACAIFIICLIVLHVCFPICLSASHRTQPLGPTFFACYLHTTSLLCPHHIHRHLLLLQSHKVWSVVLPHPCHVFVIVVHISRLRSAFCWVEVDGLLHPSRVAMDRAPRLGFSFWNTT